MIGHKNVTNATALQNTTIMKTSNVSKPTDNIRCTNQTLRRSGVERIVRTMRAPLIGGLEYIGRMRIFSCDSVRWASSGDEQTNENAPIRSPANHSFNGILLGP